MSDDPRPIPAPAELFDLTGKVAIVTGGSRGLGRAISEGLARAGADIVIASRKLDACERAAEEITAATGRRALPYACHVGRWDELDGLADAAYDEFGKVDVLVNNAGMSPLYDDVRDVTEELWDKTVGLNLKGPFRLTALVGSRMFEGDGGSVVFVSSQAAFTPPTNSIPYGAAKAGLHSMTKGFADAVATQGPREHDLRGSVPHRHHEGVAGHPRRHRRARGGRRCGALLRQRRVVLQQRRRARRRRLTHQARGN